MVLKILSQHGKVVRIPWNLKHLKIFNMKGSFITVSLFLVFNILLVFCFRPPTYPKHRGRGEEPSVIDKSMLFLFLREDPQHPKASQQFQWCKTARYHEDSAHHLLPKS